MKEETELLLIDLKEVLIEEYCEMMKFNKMEIDEAILSEIVSFYNWKINKTALSIENTFDFINEWFDSNNSIFFVSPDKIRKKQGLISLYKNKFGESYLVSIMAINKETLLKSGYKENEIIECNKEMSRETFLKLFAINNLYLYPQINLSRDNLFDNRNGKYDIYWKHVEKNAIELCKNNKIDFHKNLDVLKEKLKIKFKEFEGIPHEREDSFDLKVHIINEINAEDFFYESNQIDAFNEINSSFMMKTNKDAYIKNKRTIKHSLFSDSRAGLMLLNDEENLLAFLAKDLLSALNNKDTKLDDFFPLWRFVITDRSMVLNENAYDQLMNVFNKTAITNEERIKQALSWKILDSLSVIFFSSDGKIKLLSKDQVLNVFNNIDNLNLDKESEYVINDIDSIKRFKEPIKKKYSNFFHKDISQFMEIFDIGILSKRCREQIVSNINNIFSRGKTRITISKEYNVIIESNFSVSEKVIFQTLIQFIDKKHEDFFKVMTEDILEEEEQAKLDIECFEKMMNENILLENMEKIDKKKNTHNVKRKI